MAGVVPNPETFPPVPPPSTALKAESTLIVVPVVLTVTTSPALVRFIVNTAPAPTKVAGAIRVSKGSTRNCGLAWLHR
jgi:hypothetical protein